MISGVILTLTWHVALAQLFHNPGPRYIAMCQPEDELHLDPNEWSFPLRNINLALRRSRIIRS